MASKGKYQQALDWLHRELGEAVQARKSKPQQERVNNIKAALECVKPHAELEKASNGEEALRLA